MSFVVGERLVRSRRAYGRPSKSGPPLPKSVPSAAEERAFLCQRAHRLLSKSWPFAVVERTVYYRRAGRSLCPAPRPTSSCASLPHGLRQTPSSRLCPRLHILLLKELRSFASDLHLTNFQLITSSTMQQYSK